MIAREYLNLIAILDELYFSIYLGTEVLGNNIFRKNKVYTFLCILIFI